MHAVCSLANWSPPPARSDTSHDSLLVELGSNRVKYSCADPSRAIRIIACPVRRSSSASLTPKKLRARVRGDSKSQRTHTGVHYADSLPHAIKWRTVCNRGEGRWKGSDCSAVCLEGNCATSKDTTTNLTEAYSSAATSREGNEPTMYGPLRCDTSQI